MLIFQFTNLDGETLTTLTQHEGGDVTIPLNDSRTATVTLKLDNPACAHVLPLKRMLKVWFVTPSEAVYLVFWGVILNPTWTSQGSEPDGRNVTINAHDQTIWWKRNNLRYGDRAVNQGFEFSGKGIRRLAEAAIPGQGLLDNGVRHPGIDWGSGIGVDTTTGFLLDADGVTYIDGHGPQPEDFDNPVAGEGLWGRAVRSSLVYDTIQGVTQIINGPDWQVRPYDYGPTGGNPKPGYYARLDTFASQGEDKSAEVVFHKGFGRDDLEGFEWTPDGGEMRNYCVSVYPGGEKAIADDKHRRLAYNVSSWNEYGIYERWESTNEADPPHVLQRRADFYVDLLSEIPDFFTIALKSEEALANELTPHVYMEDFIVGDEIRAACQDQYMQCDLVGRIQAVTLTQGTAQGTSVTALECVPMATVAAEGGDSGE